MNERIPSDPELNGSAEPSGPAAAGRVSTSRRHFARAGAAAPVVLGSLLSKSAMAVQPYNCTVSGQMSGNTSPRPGRADCKTLGRSPGYWKNASAWPTGVVKGVRPNAACSFGTNKGTVFGGFSSAGQVLMDAFRHRADTSTCNVYGLRDPAFVQCNAKATMLQVLHTPGGLNDTMIYALGRATVATILNALQGGADFPVSPAQAIKMFNAVAPLGGKYQVNASVSWNDTQVLAYFQSLYS